MGNQSPLVLSMGEPAGIGPELAAQAWLRRRSHKVPAFVYLGDIADLARRIRLIGCVVPLREAYLAEATSIFDDALPVINIAMQKPSIAGAPEEANAAAVIEAISVGASFCLREEAAGIITNPIQKSTLYAAGFKHPGHTEFLGALAQEAGYPNASPVMMLASDELRVVPVTVHCALRNVPELLTKALIVNTARIVVHDLRTRFGLHAPRLAIAGLNPHAGEEGALGREELDIIAPAIAQLRNEGIKVRGPLPADTMFHAHARESYDAALTMYHDQALIPIKALAFERAVNTTLGLPFIRTSPDHGTALTLAGTGTGDPTSLIEAIKLAGELAARQLPA